MLAQTLNATLNLIFPPECEICGKMPQIPSFQGVCEICRLTIHPIPAPHCAGCGRTVGNGTSKCARCFHENFSFDRAYACSFYEGNIKELLHIYKFSGRKNLKHFFIGLMLDFCRQHLDISAIDSLISVPMDTPKENERGFNQAGKLSHGLAKKLSKPDHSSGLIRTKRNKLQHFLTKNERKLNIKDAFSVVQKDLFEGKRILLIDDILTTGQTVSECARVLKNSGALSVTALTCARGI